MDYEEIYLKTRRTPLCDVPTMVFGNMPNDGGNLILTPEEKDNLINKEPQANKYINEFIIGKDFLNNKKKYCIWLNHYNPAELQKCPLILKKVENVKNLRSKSKRKATRELAKIPTRFGEVRQPSEDYILIPLTTSENREYIPMTIMDKNIIVNNTCGIVNSNDPFILGILTSKMHMTWVKYVCGKLEGRYRYSPSLVYNNFPFPVNVTSPLREAISKCADEILNIRESYDASLAQLYTPTNGI